ncbi:sugar phosphate isomerase/epimerase family protein [Maribellus maritimus]|uniref:sugar phosphate isomerase/epimerase family protein n=1 Tax=Maribellus maritimus TaxID=2870838 RepID=UPI001EEC558D|nr:sugar phosphate isomerase/epimerase family protein [Maribellus maritimus]MCG6188287.1 sugar phosphate isomerase/epimerase [Maribellus maritimus]
MNLKNVIRKGIVIITISFSLFIISCKSDNNILLQDVGICTDFNNATILSASGCTYIEESVGRFLIPSKSEEEFDKILEKAKESELSVMAFNSFIPGNLKSVGPEAVHSQILKYVEIAFRRAQKTGVKYIVFGSGGSRSIPEGFSKDDARQQFVSLCTRMAPIAGKYNVVVVLEPLNKKECNFINSVAEGGEIVKEVNHPNFMLLADIYHMLMDNENPDNIIKYGDLIKHTHIAEKEGRAAPGTYNEDFKPYLEALKKVKYSGMMSIECNWDNLESESVTSIAEIKKQVSMLE